MKKIMLSAIVAASFLISCSSDDAEKTTTNGFSNNPVSGVVYSQSFTAGGGTANPVTSNGEDVLYIHLSRTAMNCGADTDTPIWIIVPAEVGSYTSETGASVQFSDDATESFEGGFGERVEITSITENTVKGRVISEGFDKAENSINGTFEVNFCGID